VETRTPRELVFRCIAYPHTLESVPGYYAQCIDLDLMVWRPTFQDARHELGEQIRGYIESIHSKQDFENLVPRKAPFWPYRVRYHLAAALRQAIPRPRLEMRKGSFEWELLSSEICQATPA
jgi:hypothetical protein